MVSFLAMAIASGARATVVSDTLLGTELAKKQAAITSTNKLPAANVSGLATVATSGSYNDLNNKPTIPTVPTNVSAFNNDAGYITSAEIPSQVQANWTATEGNGVILNKPTLATVATSGSYNDLTNKPTIDSVLSDSSTNAVQNKVVKAALDAKQDTIPANTYDAYGAAAAVEAAIDAKLGGGVFYYISNKDKYTVGDAIDSINSSIEDNNESIYTINAKLGGGFDEENTVADAINAKQDTISDLGTIRSGAAAGATAVQPSAITDMETKTHAAATYQPKGNYETAGAAATVEAKLGSGFSAQNTVADAINAKQDTISDLSTIRSGAAAGATAVQPSAITDMETQTHAAATYQPKGNYETAGTAAAVEAAIDAKLGGDFNEDNTVEDEIDSLWGSVETLDGRVATFSETIGGDFDEENTVAGAISEIEGKFGYPYYAEDEFTHHTVKDDLDEKQNKLTSSGNNANVVAGTATGNVVTSISANNGTVTVNKAAGVITNTDVASNAAIDQSKISGLGTALSNAQNKIPSGSENSSTLASIWVE